jgi:hypothetical protein
MTQTPTNLETALTDKVDVLLAKVDPKIRALVAPYASVFVQWPVEYIAAWINMVAQGKTRAALEQVYQAMDDANLLAGWNQLNAGEYSENVKNADRISAVRNAGAFVLNALVELAIAAIG